MKIGPESFIKLVPGLLVLLLSADAGKRWYCGKAGGQALSFIGRCRVLPTPTDWSISAAPAAARAALGAKLQRMALNLGAKHGVRLKAIGVRGEGLDPILMILSGFVWDF